MEQGIGGARRDRTADLLHAMQALSQLSYSPTEARTLRMPPDAVKPLIPLSSDCRTGLCGEVSKINPSQISGPADQGERDGYRFSRPFNLERASR